MNEYFLHCDMDENSCWNVDGCGNLKIMLEALKAAVVTVSDKFNFSCDVILGLVAVQCQKTGKEETEAKE